jgi:hypothetical protein
MKIIYRISDNGYNKVKPKYINNRNCLWNAVNIFPDADWTILADNISDDTYKMMVWYLEENKIQKVSIGHGAGTFNLALDKALTFDDDEIVYFLENDYLHRPNSQKIIEEGLNEMEADYLTLYLHPDKFIPPHNGGNPNVDYDGGYLTKIYLSKNNNVFFQVDSTTMTFAAKVKTLREDEQILRQFTSGTYPEDYKMFLELRKKGKVLLCPIETKSTHGETKWLAPLPFTSTDKLMEEWKKFL